MNEAVTLFSPERDAYAFGELDEIGKANLAAFASASGVQFEFMPVEGRLYFMRKRSEPARGQSVGAADRASRRAT